MKYFIVALCANLIALSGIEARPFRNYDNQSPADTTQIKADLDSASRLVNKGDPQAIDLLQRCLRDSRKLNYGKGEGNSLYYMGKYYGSLRQHNDAIRLYDSALVVFHRFNIQNRVAQCYIMKGTIYLTDNKFSMAIGQYEKSIVVNTTLGNKTKVADCLVNIGVAYERLGNYPKALDHYFQCLKMDEELDNKPGIASDYGCIATVYGKMNEADKAIEFYDKAVEQTKAIVNADIEFELGTILTNYGIFSKNNKEYEKSEQLQQEALAIFKKLESKRGIGSTLHNIGALHQAKGEFQLAISFYNQSLEYVEGGNKDALGTNYLGMAQTYFQLKQYTKALDHAFKARAFIDDIKMLDDQVKVTKLISDIYREQGNYKQAFAFYQLYAIHKDSLFNLEKSRQVEDLQTKYETEKKEQEIATLTKERKLQDASLQSKTIIQYALIAGILIFIGFAFIIFRNNKAKQEARRLLLDEQLKNEHVEAEKLKELDHLKSRFFANIAHEFRTPLTLILGPVENLIGESKEAPFKNQLMLVKSSANRLVKLVNQLLDLSKLEAGAIKMDYVNDDVISFLKANTFAFQSLADQKNIRISFLCDITSLPMKFDRDKLEKIFSNLLSNAFKFTNSGGQVSVSVQVTENSANKKIRVTVNDSGPGIPAADVPYVFNRFYQSGTVSRSTLGSGIGLELTKELVEICGGEIGVSNADAGGAQFYFTLPVIEGEKDITNEINGSYLSSHAAIAIEDARDTPSILTAPVESENHELILVIEDNNEVRDYIVSALQSQYQVITAEDGEKGIVKALDAVPDLIITDVMMPGKDGLEVSRTLKEDERTSHIPIIMLTAKADMESKIEGLLTGADDYLAKPFHTKELVVRIQNLIQQRKKLQEKFKEINEKKIADDSIPLKEKLFISKLRETIELHLTEEEYSVEDLSHDMAMSRMQLHRKVKALTNSSASLYIRSIRLMHAKRLLEEGIYNVSEVAYRVGFNSPTYFSTCFSEEYGIPPSEFRIQQV